jgi:HlyD family secretion protein
MESVQRGMVAAGETPIRRDRAESGWLRRHWHVLLPVVLVLLAVGAALLFEALRPRTSSSAIRFETVPASRGAIQARVTASGTLSALVTVQVGSQISGRIQWLGADYNTVVRKGQVVARIDPSLYTAAVEQARAKVLTAVANRQLAESQRANVRIQAERNRALRRESLVSQSAVDDSDTALRVAEAQTRAAAAQEADARATLHQAEINLAYTTIVAPIDGVVISRNVDVGQTVAATLQSPTLFLVAQDLRKMQVDTNVAEADVGRIAAGMTASFTVDAYSAETFRGTIREVRNAPQTVQNVVTYDAVIDVDNPELKLKPGMTANVTVVYADRADVVRLPNAAVRFRAPPAMVSGAPPAPPLRPDQRLVWLLGDGQARPVAVRLGVSDGVLSEVLEGAVRPGDLAVTEAVAPSKSGPGSYGRVF